ncbi:MAG TPA: ABC transporter permease [Terriglobales bacterium]|nr:ABC transporter permease [Terriglobales bacterium]
MRDIVAQGWVSLMRHRMRSLLSMLGIVWGLVTVVLLLGYGQGVGESVFSAFSGIGNNVVFLWSGQTSMQAGGQRAGKRIRFHYQDAQAIREEVPLVKAVSVEEDDILGFKYGNRVVSVMTRAIQYPYREMRRMEIADGRYFEESDFVEHRRVVIFGPNAAKKVLGGRPPVGEHVSIEGHLFEVIGVLGLKIQDSSTNGPDNENAFVPYETMSDIKYIEYPDMIVFQPVSPELNKKALAAVRAVLARRHQFDPRDDKATPEWDTVEDSQELKQFSIGLQVLLGLIGALTLGVGGVGVMNIMLVSVTERTREIGLRKAVGARRRQILVQFLVEALVITFVGGAVGMLLAVALAHLIPPMPLYSAMYETPNNEGDIFLQTSALVMGVSFAILTLVGVCSGFWPALKAARMDPVEALRYE